MELEIPGYKLIRTLGKGGMATVYLAEQTIFEREVALKVMSKSLADDPAFGQRFFREAKIVSQLVHPNIVTVHDVGVHEDSFYLSMEYIDGGDLRQRRKAKDFDLRQKIATVRDIAKALHYAGSKGYVHRDIKPENIMFHTADGRAVLTDFGIARTADIDVAMTQTGMAIGTPHYMSPEQAKGKSVDVRSDLYSLGVVFYLLLTDKVPFDGESAVTIGIKHITEPVPLLPHGLDFFQPLINRLMAKKTMNRYQSAMDFIAELDALDLLSAEESWRYVQQGQVMPSVNSFASNHYIGFVDDDHSEDDTEQFTVEVDAVTGVLPNESSFWPWAVSLSVVGCILLGVLYIVRPPLLEPVIAQVEIYVGVAAKKVNDMWFDFTK